MHIGVREHLLLVVGPPARIPARIPVELHQRGQRGTRRGLPQLETARGHFGPQHPAPQPVPARATSLSAATDSRPAAALRTAVRAALSRLFKTAATALTSVDGMNFHAQIADSAAEAARVAAAVTDEQLSGATPCPDYDTRTLINHWVAYTGLGMELRARKEAYPDDLAERDFTAEPGWADAYAAQLKRSAAAWADPAAWEGEVDMGGMSMPTEAVAGMLFLELVLHGWDVAKATGQEFRADEKSAALLLAVVREQAEMFRRYKGFAEPVEPPAGAGDFELAVALSGRDPYWSA